MNSNSIHYESRPILAKKVMKVRRSRAGVSFTCSQKIVEHVLTLLDTSNFRSLALIILKYEDWSAADTAADNTYSVSHPIVCHIALYFS